MASPFAGNWKHVENENFDDFLKAVGKFARRGASASACSRSVYVHKFTHLLFVFLFVFLCLFDV